MSEKLQMPKKLANQFFIDIFNEEYVLLVGSEVILNKQVTGKDGSKILFYDVNKYIRHKLGCCSFNTVESKRIRDAVNSIEYSIEDISKELLDFLDTKLFKIVLTTSIDDYMVKAMEEVWGKGNYDVVNFTDEDQVAKWTENLIDYVNAKPYTKESLLKPTLVYVFGRACEDTNYTAGGSVYNDNDAIKFIMRWIINSTHKSQTRWNTEKQYDDVKNMSVMDFIRSKKILSLGCKFDDWYCRFFWYLMTGRLEHNQEEGMRGQVSFDLNKEEIKSEKKLNYFLENAGIYRHQDAQEFMKWFVDIVTLKNSEYQETIIKYSRIKGGIFLSYCSKDTEFACDLFFKLKQMNYKVWIDKCELPSSQDYIDDIRKAIKASKVFVMLLSNEVKRHSEDDMKKGKESWDYHFYRDEEWIFAKDKHITILPVAIEDYNLGADYHTKFCESIIGCHPDCVNLNAKDPINGTGWEKLVTLLNDKLNLK